jgi:hypothetical protein
MPVVGIRLLIVHDETPPQQLTSTTTTTTMSVLSLSPSLSLSLPPLPPHHPLERHACKNRHISLVSFSENFSRLLYKNLLLPVPTRRQANLTSACPVPCLNMIAMRRRSNGEQAASYRLSLYPLPPSLSPFVAVSASHPLHVSLQAQEHVGASTS